MKSDLDRQVSEAKNSPIWKEAMCRKYIVASQEKLDSLLDEFALDMICKGMDVRNAKALFAKWMDDWMKTRPVSELHPDWVNSDGKPFGPGEYRNEKGQRAHIWRDKEVIVPEDAPPRPSERHYWYCLPNYYGEVHPCWNDWQCGM